MVMCDSHCAAGAFDARMRWDKGRIERLTRTNRGCCGQSTTGSSTWSRRLEIHVYDI
jgi:hypothetical protein